MALSLQEEQRSQDLSWEQLQEDAGDLKLARKLQEEEDRRASQYYQEQEPAATTVATAPTTAEGQVKVYWQLSFQGLLENGHGSEATVHAENGRFGSWHLSRWLWALKGRKWCLGFPGMLTGSRLRKPLVLLPAEV